jgi:transposase
MGPHARRTRRLGRGGHRLLRRRLGPFPCRSGPSRLEVNRPDRQARRRRGKSDPLDAEAAARAVQAGQATVAPKTGTGQVEMIRSLRVARQTAIRARTQAINAFKALLVTAPVELREQLCGLPATMLVPAAAALEPAAITSPLAAAMLALRTVAQRYQALDAEITILTAELDRLLAMAAPKLLALFGAGQDSAGRAAGRRRRQPRPPALRGRLLDAVRGLADRGVLG